MRLPHYQTNTPGESKLEKLHSESCASTKNAIWLLLTVMITGIVLTHVSCVLGFGSMSQNLIPLIL